ncbi:response regulator [Patescibacteria group bacterium]|nr:response regulator [Patescibacteria group bacterium]
MQKDIRILIVDDDQKTRTELKEFLEDEGYEIETAEFGQKAIDILNDDPKKFKLIVLDILLPDIDGIRILKMIKNDINPKIFVIMYTWYDYRDDFDVWASEAYIVKGKESQKELLNQIKKLFGS